MGPVIDLLVGRREEWAGLLLTLLGTCKAVAFFFDLKVHGTCLSLLPCLPSPGFWSAKSTALVLFARLRTVGISQINCIHVLYNRDFQADKFCFMPSCSFRVGVMDAHFIQTGIFKNPVSR